jgi:hypothetical protein
LGVPEQPAAAFHEPLLYAHRLPQGPFVTLPVRDEVVPTVDAVTKVSSRVT